jgi:transposase, IS30 family
MKNKHLTREERATIEQCLNQGDSFKEIARILDKDCSTISKEVRSHLHKEKKGSYGRSFNDCALAHTRQCGAVKVCSSSCSSHSLCPRCGKCTSVCEEYVPYTCPQLTKPPYVCNHCDNRNRCTLEKSRYIAYYAQREYEDLRSESRSGFALSQEELSHLDDIVSPLLLQGQSLHHIALAHADETMVCERTLYSYVNSSLFSARNIDMPRTVRMRPRKKHSNTFKVDKACRIGRSWNDYKAFMSEHPDLPVCQLDSVEGIRGGKVLLTVHFVGQKLQLAFLRDANNARSVTDIFQQMYTDLGPKTYARLFPVLLADNGSEFSNPSAIEKTSEEYGASRVFYCNPSAPYQKGACENNHELIRRIIPKGIDIGQYSQEQIDLMMSHINSYTRANLGNKSPYDVFEFSYGSELLSYWNIRRIPADEIILKPELLA